MTHDRSLSVFIAFKGTNIHRFICKRAQIMIAEHLSIFDSLIYLFRELYLPLSRQEYDGT